MENESNNDPENNLGRTLEKNAPILAGKISSMDDDFKSALEDLFKMGTVIQKYASFLYSLPSNKNRQCWEQYIEVITNQIDLKENINFLRSDKLSKPGSRAIIIHADRPLFDSIPLHNGEKIGNAKGYIGTLNYSEVIQDPFSVFDERIYNRVILSDALELTEEQLTEWAGNNLTYFHLRQRAPLDSTIQKFRNLPNGSKKVTLCDLFPNIDCCKL